MRIVKNALRDARKLYDIKQILGIGPRKNVIVCPLPQHKHSSHTPSFSIFTDIHGVQRWRCHGSCSLRGDVIDLIGYKRIPGYNPGRKEDVGRAVTLLETGQDISIPVKNTQRASTLADDLWKQFVPAGPEALEYLARRGISAETAERFGYGQLTTSPEGYALEPYTTWLTMPTFTGARLTKIKMRNIYSTDKRNRYKALSGSVIGIHNLNAVKEKSAPVLIVKGELSVALLSQYGILACAPNAGEGATEEWMYLALVFSRKRVVIGDNDPEPIMKQTRLLLEKRAHMLHADARLPPEQYHDIDDFVNAEPEVAIPMIRDWMKVK
jgi:hypothetical protein